MHGAHTDKSDNAQRNHTLIVLLCFLLRSMHMRESHVVISRWLKVELKVTLLLCKCGCWSQYIAYYDAQDL